MVANGQVVVVDDPVYPDGIYAQQKAPKGIRGILGSLDNNSQQCVLFTETLQRYSLMKRSKMTPVPDDEAYQFRLKASKGSYSPRKSGTTGNTGSDPEIFVLGGDGKVLPAFNFLPHKDKPLDEAIQNSGNKGWAKAFWDGFQAEFSVLQASCHEVLAGNIRHGMNLVLQAARKVDPKATLTPQSVIEVPYETMMAAPPEGRLLGCAPSENLYGTKPIEVQDPEQLILRFAGCHVHLGCGKQDKESLEDMIRTMDRIAGVLSVSLLQGLEDERRRIYYGRAGEYRIPSHGLEYRTLSSTMLIHPAVMHLMFDLSRCAAQCSRDGLSFIWDSTDDETMSTINNYDVAQAKKILKRNDKVVRSILMAVYYKESPVERCMALLKNGAKAYLSTNMMENWGFSGSAGITAQNKVCYLSFDPKKKLSS